MFGTLRLILAIGVILSHIGVHPFGLNVGVSSVVGFFMISGYAMSGLISTAFPRLSDVPAFYADRALRLAPQYYLYLLVCIVALMTLDWHAPDFQSGRPDFVNVAANLTVLPLTFWMFSDSIHSLLINTPTWSLGLELCFYVVLPFFLTGRAALWLAALVGAVVWTLATQAVIHPDYYGYRLLPGVLVFFLYGVALQRKDWLLAGALILFFAGSAAVLWIGGKFWLVFNASMLVGAAFACLALPILALFRRRSADEYLGAISYGAYLAHWPFVMALYAYSGQAWAVTMTVASAVLCGWASYHFVEAPTVRYRRARRDRSVPSATAAAPAE